MEENNEFKPNEQIIEKKPKKKGLGILILLLILIILGLAGYICYDKFLAKKDEPAIPKEVEKKPDDSQDNLNTNEYDKCIGYKTFTKYEEDNLELYNRCLKQEDDSYTIPDYSDDFKVYYSTDEMKIGFLNDDDEHGYRPRSDLSVFNEKNYDFITNKDGDDLVTFGRIYADIYGDDIHHFLWVYTDVFNYETCVTKDFLIELSNQIYGNSTTFVSELFSDETPYYHSNNIYCFAGTGFGPGEDFEYYSQNKNGNKWTIKYKNVSGWDTTGKKYSTIDFELKDGYWTVQSFKLSDN